MRRCGCFGLVVVLLLAVIAYDQWKIHKLTTEMTTIASKIHKAKGTAGAAHNSDLASTLAQAQAYTRQAQEFLNSKNLAKAQDQLSRAKKDLDSASKFSKAIYDNSADFLGKAEKRTVKVFNGAMKDMAGSPKSKVESSKSKDEDNR